MSEVSQEVTTDLNGEQVLHMLITQPAPRSTENHIDKEHYEIEIDLGIVGCRQLSIEFIFEKNNPVISRVKGYICVSLTSSFRG